MPDHLPTLTIMPVILTSLHAQTAEPTHRDQQYGPGPRRTPNLLHHIRHYDLLATRAHDFYGEAGEVGLLWQLFFEVGAGLQQGWGAGGRGQAGERAGGWEGRVVVDGLVGLEQARHGVEG
jgi:hypothetical protein